MKILTLCGSIRKDSSNYSLLVALQTLSSSTDEWIHFDIAQLPYFDPQLQFSSELPWMVTDLRKKAHEADCIVISTPEYAHGIPGILKNALEWLICEESMKKKVFVIVASASGGNYVKDYLIETLRTMDMNTGPEMTLAIRTARTDVLPSGEIRNPALTKALLGFMQKFLNSPS